MANLLVEELDESRSKLVMQFQVHPPLKPQPRHVLITTSPSTDRVPFLGDSKCNGSNAVSEEKQAQLI